MKERTPVAVTARSAATDSDVSRAVRVSGQNEASVTWVNDHRLYARLRLATAFSKGHGLIEPLAALQAALDWSPITCGAPGKVPRSFST